VEGLELDLWVAPAGAAVFSNRNNDTGTDSSSSAATTARASRGVVGRLAPALWRRRPVVALALDPPLPMAASLAQRLCALSLGYGFAASGALPPDVWPELQRNGCVDALGSSGSRSGNRSESAHVSASFAASGGGGGGFAGGANLRPIAVASGWLGTGRRPALFGSAATVGPQDPIALPCSGTAGTEGAAGSSSSSGSTAGSSVAWPRVADLPGQAYAVLHWLPIALPSSADGRAGVRSDSLPLAVAYLQAYAAAHAMAASLAAALESNASTNDDEGAEEAEALGDDEPCVSWAALPVEMPLARGAATPHGSLFVHGAAATAHPALLLSLCTLRGSSSSGGGFGGATWASGGVRASNAARPLPAVRLLLAAPLPPGYTWTRDVGDLGAAAAHGPGVSSGMAITTAVVEGGDEALAAAVAVAVAAAAPSGNGAVEAVAAAAAWLLARDTTAKEDNRAGGGIFGGGPHKKRARA
jgi:hypothetical protein